MLPLPQHRAMIRWLMLLVRHGAAAALVTLTVACGNASNITDRIAGHRTSPFELFGRDDMRAGLRFDVLKDAASKESVKQYSCASLWAKAQRCAVHIETGYLHAIVDSTGRVIRLVASTDPTFRSGINVHGQLIFRDVVRDTRAAWDSVALMRRDDSDPQSPQLLWIDRTQHWGASLWYSRSHRADVPVSPGATGEAELAMTLPESISVTDMPAYALFTQLRPLSPGPVIRSSNKPAAEPPPPTKDEILTMLRSDLRAVTIAEESALHQTGQYETILERLQLTPSPGVHVELLHPTGNGWSAVATHNGLPELSCVVFAGDVPAIPATRRQNRRGTVGEVVCDQP
jgi:hypothetical protein